MPHRRNGATAPPETESAKTPERGGRVRDPRDPQTMIPARSKRFAVESALMRLVATAGIVGIGVALGAILASSDVQGWIIGLVVALVSVVLAAVLWSSRRV